jgi:hypothetical protein
VIRRVTRRVTRQIVVDGLERICSLLDRASGYRLNRRHRLAAWSCALDDRWQLDLWRCP